MEACWKEFGVGGDGGIAGKNYGTQGYMRAQPVSPVRYGWQNASEGKVQAHATADTIPLGVSPDDERPVSDEFPIGKGRGNKWRAIKSANHWWFNLIKSK